MLKECYINVSDAALCQRCPALLAYKIYRGFKDAWKVGIKGSGFSYGSMFHKEIAQVFFEGASNPADVLHAKIARSLKEGRQSVEAVIREEIFTPFLSAKSRNYGAGQLMAMAEGITVWVRAMCEFFAGIPSLSESPEEIMPTVFIKPEQKLKGYYKFPEGKLNVIGCYDALMFNPDRGEARLFEFKSYMKSDIAVPLSQSLIYSWLIWQHTGIIPSVEIIYLGDEDKEPEIFSSSGVGSMIKAGLPGLFRSVFEVRGLGRVHSFMNDENLCSQCPFNGKCKDDWSAEKPMKMKVKMKKRKGVSLLNIMVFMMFAVMVTAQVFFFAQSSMESVAEEREILMYRFNLDSLVEEAKKALLERGNDKEITHNKNLNKETNALTYETFYDGTKVFDDDDLGSEWKNAENKTDPYHIRIHDLDYEFDSMFNRNDYVSNYGNEDMNKKLFAVMSYDPKKDDDGNIELDAEYKPIPIARYFLIRAYAELPKDKYYDRKLMYQVLVRRNKENETEKPYTLDTLSFQEVWF